MYLGPWFPFQLESVTKVESEASELRGRAPWWGWTPLQSSAKPPRQPRCPPTPTRPGALTPPLSGDGIEKGLGFLSAPSLELLDSFAPKSC